MSKIIYDPENPEKVYLRPSSANRPIKHVDTIEKAGLIVDVKHGIAMFTHRSTPNQGPAGPPGTPGEDQNSLFDTIIASASDENTPILTGGPKTTFRAPYPLDLTLGYIRISLTNAPTGAAFIVDVTMNGVSMFATKVQIDAGAKTSVGSAVPAVLAITAVPDDAEFLVYVDQVGSTYQGSGLKVAVTGIKAE
jgi:hypothetical protein